MAKYLLEFDEASAAYFSRSLVVDVERVGRNGYAGMTEVEVCETCTAIVTDINVHNEQHFRSTMGGLL